MHFYQEPKIITIKKQQTKETKCGFVGLDNTTNWELTTINPCPYDFFKNGYRSLDHMSASIEVHSLRIKCKYRFSMHSIELRIKLCATSPPLKNSHSTGGTLQKKQQKTPQKTTIVDAVF